jgi:site-specific recombinase XerD
LRHSFATSLKKKGIDESFISEFLGHHSVETTRIYLDSFDTHEKDKISKSVAII